MKYPGPFFYTSINYNIIIQPKGFLMSHAKTMLDAIEAVLEGRIDSDVEQYQIAGRQITKIPILELKKLRDDYRAEYKKEQKIENIKLGKSSTQIMHARF